MAKWARTCERYCCIGLTYSPFVFIYSITSWAIWVEVTIGALAQGFWIGTGSSILGVTLYILLNWSYTTAAFMSPGTTTGNNGYSSLPTYSSPSTTNYTVKSNGELRYCKKCQARKPDRAHHCNTCKTCVLKMDHHCPWLATCLGLRNYKAFLLFLIYTTLFCFLCFGVSATWVWGEITNDGQYTEDLMPINYVMLAVMSGIIGLVLAGFTGWHILLASRGQTTIECLEKTRYLSPLRKSMQQQHFPQSNDYNERQDMYRPEDNTPMENGEERRHNTYDEMERYRARRRYEEYLDQQDSEKLPSAFDLGWKRNFLHLFGPNKSLWLLPISTTTGDGWNWDPSPKWIAARDKIAAEREEQKLREQNAGWGGDPPPISPPAEGAGRHYVAYPSRSPSNKADRILGRSPNQFTDDRSVPGTNTVSMRTLHPRSDLDEDQYENGSDEDDAERILDRKADIITTVGGWPHRVGIVTNTLLGNTLSRQKDDVRGWDGIDDGVE